MTRFVELGQVIGAAAPADGTYLDARVRCLPYEDVASPVPLAALVAIPGIVLDADVEAGAIDLGVSERLVSGRAVLVRTGWDRHWGSERYRERRPYLAQATVDGLIEGGALLVGVDFWSVDDIADPAQPARTRLLTAGVIIVEHLCNLRALPREGFRFSAVPLQLAGAAPVRVFAELLPP